MPYKDFIASGLSGARGPWRSKALTKCLAGSAGNNNMVVVRTNSLGQWHSVRGAQGAVAPAAKLGGSPSFSSSFLRTQAHLPCCLPSHGVHFAAPAGSFQGWLPPTTCQGRSRFWGHSPGLALTKKARTDESGSKDESCQPPWPSLPSATQAGLEREGMGPLRARSPPSLPVSLRPPAQLPRQVLPDGISFHVD